VEKSLSKNDLISIIIPVYNAEKYLIRCIESILNQTYKNFELILVDDGSSDHSLSICNEFKMKDERLKVLHISNSGSAVARNKGLEIMTGEYLIFVDADDWIEKDAIQKTLDSIRSSKDDIIFFSVFSTEKNNTYHVGKIPKFNKDKILKCILSGDTSEYSDMGYYIDSIWAKIYRRSFIEENSIRFPDKLIRSQDTVFSLYTTELAKSISFNDYRFYHYEKNEDSICNKYSNKSVRIIPELLRENDKFIEKYYKDNELFKVANSKGLFPRMIEAERNYFFHTQNRKSERERYKEYKTLLCNPTVRSHISSIKNAGLNRNQKLKMLLYRHPTFILFRLYAKVIKR